ncbi:hypothetical protein Poli38472_002568 [Pythium oligandrum]|uniref:C2 domain-containing protein n=1 Tax=Pythium oligandrum TaxID=41045 RepID=A0A8K1CJZ4_PYTOL|nr:hypothetical protein Poli38472_002568 [Pythium oligandrum]|eukprot:TMW63627.1 hypothetical protein Poli38472_002568 [Pythium oligandrum]
MKSGRQRVGQRIHVYWSDETAWFSGIVQEYDAAQGFYVLYDDGDERWEGEQEIYRFEGDADHEGEDDDQQEREGEGAIVVSGAAEVAQGDHEDGEDEDEEGDGDAIQSDEKDQVEMEDESPAEESRSVPSCPQPIVLQHDNTASEGEESEEDDESVTASEAPILYEAPSRQTSTRAQSVSAVRALPHRGVLQGSVLRATRLPLIGRTEEPNAFVRIAFVEAGSSNQSLMLRCKQVLAVTLPAGASTDPVWNNEESTGASGKDDDGRFQLQVAPPFLGQGAAQQPAWQQLRGDLLFSIYHSAQDRANDFIGQASIPLSRIMRDALLNLDTSISIPLESRQGNPLSSGAELFVAFQFEPEYAPERRQSVLEKAPSKIPSLQATSRQASTASLSAAGKTSSVRSAKKSVASSKASAKRHQSSSEVNRRKFERQVAQENQAMAKRSLNHHRRREAKYTFSTHAETKTRGSAGDHRTHKASSNINRNKFHQQLHQDNKAMGKRLAAIVQPGADAAKKWRDERKDVFAAQDKDWVRDKRRLYQQEKDYLQEKAQAKYQAQNELVDDVMALQTQLAEVKTQVASVKANVNRIVAMNKRDSHVRDCLQRAASKDKSRGEGTSDMMWSDDEGDVDDSTPSGRYRKDLRVLRQEAQQLQTQKQHIERQSIELDAQENTMEEEIVELHRKWHFVQTKRAFQQKMASAATGYRSKEMKSKRDGMELSAEEEEQYAIYKAQLELTQLQIAVSVLNDKLEKGSGAPSRLASGNTAFSCTSSAASEYLQTKVEKRVAKIKRLETEIGEWRSKYETMMVSGEYEQLRKQIQELQHLFFVCQSEAKHVAAAERAAQHTKEQMTSAFQRQMLAEQTETEILFKKRQGKQNMKQ